MVFGERKDLTHTSGPEEISCYLKPLWSIDHAHLHQDGLVNWSLGLALLEQMYVKLSFGLGNSFTA